MPLTMTPHLWALAGVASLLIGMSKTGLPGLGLLGIALYAVIFPSRESVGLVLPLLIAGDFMAIGMYRAHAQWPHLWRLFPWAGVGIVGGYLVMHVIDGRQTQLLIGGLLVVMLGLTCWRKRHPEFAAEGTAARHSYAAAVCIGVLAGFSTMTANAAGPLMVLYLLLMGLPKLQFMGTSAWYFCVLNLVKVPFAVDLHLITADSLGLNLALVGFVLAGGLIGRVLLHRINELWFERITLGLTLVAAVKMLVG
jgi:uncharacterized membrane protein YfcA